MRVALACLLVLIRQTCAKGPVTIDVHVLNTFPALASGTQKMVPPRQVRNMRGAKDEFRLQEELAHLKQVVGAQSARVKEIRKETYAKQHKLRSQLKRVQRQLKKSKEEKSKPEPTNCTGDEEKHSELRRKLKEMKQESAELRGRLKLMKEDTRKRKEVPCANFSKDTSGQEESVIRKASEAARETLVYTKNKLETCRNKLRVKTTATPKMGHTNLTGSQADALTEQEETNATGATITKHAGVSCNGTTATFSWRRDRIKALGTVGTPAANDTVVVEQDCSRRGLCQASKTLASGIRGDVFWVKHTDGSHTKIEHTFYCSSAGCHDAANLAASAAWSKGVQTRTGYGNSGPAIAINGQLRGNDYKPGGQAMSTINWGYTNPAIIVTLKAKSWVRVVRVTSSSFPMFIEGFEILVGSAFCASTALAKSGRYNKIPANMAMDFVCDPPLQASTVTLKVPGIKRSIVVDEIEVFGSSEQDWTANSCTCYDGVRWRDLGDRHYNHGLQSMERCKTCSGPGPSQCLTCHDQHALLPFRGQEDTLQGACLKYPDAWSTQNPRVNVLATAFTDAAKLEPSRSLKWGIQNSSTWLRIAPAFGAATGNEFVRVDASCRLSKTTYCAARTKLSEATQCTSTKRASLYHLGYDYQHPGFEITTYRQSAKGAGPQTGTAAYYAKAYVTGASCDTSHYTKKNTARIPLEYTGQWGCQNGNWSAGKTPYCPGACYVPIENYNYFAAGGPQDACRDLISQF